MDIEIFKDIPFFEGVYQVSNFGRVKSLKFGKEKILKPGKNTRGYLAVVLSHNKHQYNKRIHGLVMLVFKGERTKGQEVNHIDENKENNFLYNLEYCSKSQNQKHSAHKRIKDKKLSNIVIKPKEYILSEEKAKQIRELYKSKKISYRKLGEQFNVSRTTIYYILKNICWKEISIP